MAITRKRNVLGVLVDAVDYEQAVGAVIESAVAGKPLSVTALAVHGVMTGVREASYRAILNALDMVCPDGQPVRWALNGLYHAGLLDRVYGPNLMLEVCRRAEAEKLPVFLYGSKAETLHALNRSLCAHFPNLQIAGMRASLFRTLSSDEIADIAESIRVSGARIVFCGLGCPRQEIWVHEFKRVLAMPLIAVGAAFDFHAGLLAQAPRWMQRMGLEWLFRLRCEPLRLWRRYLILNPLYVLHFLLQWSGVHLYRVDGGISRVPVNCPG